MNTETGSDCSFEPSPPRSSHMRGVHAFKNKRVPSIEIELALMLHELCTRSSSLILLITRSRRHPSATTQQNFLLAVGAAPALSGPSSVFFFFFAFLSGRAAGPAALGLPSARASSTSSPGTRWLQLRSSLGERAGPKEVVWAGRWAKERRH